MPGWNLMGDNFQPGTLTLVIDGEPQRVTPIPKLFQKLFPARVAVQAGANGQGVLVPHIATSAAVCGQ